MPYNLNNYVNICTVINDKNYARSKFLKANKMDNLFIIKYNKSKLSKENITTLGLFRSVICDEDGNILSMAPPKSINFDSFTKMTSYNDCILQEFIEGTMINVFYDTTIEDWNIATRSNIGAKCKFNMDCEETFRFMFFRCYESHWNEI